MNQKPGWLTWLYRIMALSVAIPIVGVCLLIGSIPASGAIMREMAFTLRPVEYPDSELVATHDSGGPDSLWFRQTYTTGAEIDAVMAHFERQKLDFRKKDQPAYKQSFVGGRCDEGWLSRMIAGWINEGRYPWYTADNVPLPCASVLVYELNDHPGVTYYEIWVDWPSR